MKVAVSLVIVVACVGCGGGTGASTLRVARGSDRIVTSTEVSRAFAASGLRRVSSAVSLFEKGALGTAGGLKTQYWDSDPSTLSPSVVAEIFASAGAARYVVAIGGNEENGNGAPIVPIARVGNVVVTVYANASRNERRRASQAVVALRKG